jgi:hypothetical protein
MLEVRVPRVDQSAESGTTLFLDGHCVRVNGSAVGEVAAVLAWMCPPAHVDPCDAPPDWTLVLDEAAEDSATAPMAWAVVLGAAGWPRLSVVGGDRDWLDVVGQYRRDDPLVGITVDRRSRQTRVSVPGGFARSVRWADWLIRVFFGTRMLSDGWRLLHASCVAIGGASIVIGGSAGAGKSSLAHLACTQLGAAFMADDLTLIARVGGVVTAVGWPTRICPPADLKLMGDAVAREARVVGSSWRRERWVLSPSQHAEVTGFRRAGTAPVAAVVLLEREPTVGGTDGLAADPDQEAFMTDVLGLMGNPVALPCVTDRLPVSGLMGGTPTVHVTVDQPAANLAPIVWARLRPVLGAGAVT